MNEQIGRIELDAMRKAAGITVETHRTEYYGKPQWNETVCFVWQDRQLMQVLKNESKAEALADELAMDLALQDAIGDAV